jgi:siroheme synthase-like protein
VTVIAPDICAAMAELEALTIERRTYAAGEAAAYRLVVTATGNPAVDGAVYADAEAAGVWANSADDVAHCSFILPSVHREGAVTVAVSTGGSSPALASWLRARLAAQGGNGWGEVADLLGRARQSLHEAGRSTGLVDWVALLDGPLLGFVRDGQMDKAQALVEAATGTRLAP